MTQEPQQPPVEPQGHEGQPNEWPQGQPAQPPAQPPVQPPVQQWGQPAQPPAQPPAQQWGQPAQPPAQPQYGQYAQPQYGQPQQPSQPQWGQYAQPQYGQPQGQQPWPSELPGKPVPFGHNYAAPPKPGVIPLRPLGLGEILDGAFQAARRNGKAMFGSALIFQLATTAVTLLVMFVAFGQFMGQLLSFDSTFDETDPAAAAALGGGIITYSVSILLTAFLSVIIQMVLQGALVIPVLRAVLNRKTSFGEMWRLAKPRVGSLIVLALLYAAAMVVAIVVYTLIVVGLVFAISPDSETGVLGIIGLAVLLSLPFLVAGIWLGTKVLVAPAAVVVENIGAVAAVKRSWQLTAGNWWRTFGTSLLAAIIAGVIGSIITTPVAFLAGLLTPMMVGTEATPEQLVTQMIIIQAISGVIGALVGAVTLAFQTGVMALIYVDLRMRRDGFDITLLKEAESGKDDGGIPGSPVAASFVPSPYATGTTSTGPYAPGPPPGNYGQ